MLYNFKLSYIICHFIATWIFSIFPYPFRDNKALSLQIFLFEIIFSELLKETGIRKASQTSQTFLFCFLCVVLKILVIFAECPGSVPLPPHFGLNRLLPASLLALCWLDFDSTQGKFLLGVGPCPRKAPSKLTKRSQNVPDSSSFLMQVLALIQQWRGQTLSFRPTVVKLSYSVLRSTPSCKHRLLVCTWAVFTPLYLCSWCAGVQGHQAPGVPNRS